MIARILAAVILALLAALVVQTARLHSAQMQAVTLRLDAEQARLDATTTARRADALLANAASNADAQYARGYADAQSASDALAAALRAGDVRLRQTWRCETAAAVPAPADDQRRPDGAADDRAESAARIVGAASTCDAQVTALQAWIRDAQRIVNGEGAP